MHFCCFFNMFTYVDSERWPVFRICIGKHVKFALAFVFEMVCFIFSIKVERKAKIGNRYNQVPQLTQDTIRESDKHVIFIPWVVRLYVEIIQKL